MHSSTIRRIVATGGVAALAISLAACSSDSSSGSGSTASPATASVDLAKAGCPATIVVQTDWNPEAEHGHLYELLGSDYTVDTSKKSVTGTLELDGKSTGVKLEIRAGGPAIGYSLPAAQMYTDPTITMAYVSTDDALSSYSKTPTKAFFAPLDLSPTMVMWDPATYPGVTGIKDLKAALKKTGGIWRYFSGSAYMQFLIDKGYVDKSQTDSSYDGTPANFVAAGGKDVQQGFASAEPYIYAHEVSSWDKPVKYETVSSVGWKPYASAMSVRKADFDKLTPCLKTLTPILQQAEVDYYKSPDRANKIILDLVKQYDTGWTYSAGVAAYSAKTAVADKLIGNGPNAYLGDFDDSRMSDFFTQAVAVFKETGTTVDPSLKASDIYTNEFIDKTIGFSN